MSTRPRSDDPKRGRRRLNASLAGSLDDEPAGVPVRLVKFIVALFLLPPCYVLSATFFGALSHASVRNAWLTPEFWFFSLGAILWCIFYFGFPKLYRILLSIYVFGHEATHAITVRIMGGKIYEFDAGGSGGYVMSSKINTWIALAPYFVPFYSLIVIAIYGITSAFYSFGDYREQTLWLLYGLVGATYAFHAIFTVSMIRKGQTDLTYGGTFFSLAIIYLMNVLLLSLLLIIATPHVSFWSFGREMFHQSADFVAKATQVFEYIARQISAFLS